MFNILVPEKLKDSISETPIIKHILNINNQRTKNAKLINLDIIKNLIIYSLEKIAVKLMFSLSVFNIVLFRRRSVLGPVQWDPTNDRVKFSVKNRKIARLFLE